METCSTPKERQRTYYDLHYVILYLRKIKHFWLSANERTEFTNFIL